MQLGKILQIPEKHVYVIMDFLILLRLYNYSLCLSKPTEKGFLPDLGDRHKFDDSTHKVCILGIENLL